jgi:hypothetical protein
VGEELAAKIVAVDGEPAGELRDVPVVEGAIDVCLGGVNVGCGDAVSATAGPVQETAAAN